MVDRKRKIKAGLLVIGSPRYGFQGEGTKHGTCKDRVDKEARKLIERFKEVGEIIFPGAIYTRKEVIDAADCFYNNRVDFIIATYLTWAEDFAWIRFLRDIPDIPIFLCCIREKKYQLGNLTETDNLLEFIKAARHVGILQATGSIHRVSDRRIKVFAGDIDAVVREAGIFGRAAKTKSLLKTSVFGLLPSFHEVMWSTYLDPFDFFVKVGPELRFVQISTLAEEISKVSDETAEKLTRSIEERFVVANDVERSTFIESVRASIGVEMMARKLGLDVVVLNDIDPGLISLLGLRPGFCPASFDADAAIVTSEGDIGAALAVYVLKIMSDNVVNFTEIFYPDIENGTFIAGHGGPNDYTNPKYRENVKVVVDNRFAKTNNKFAGAPFAWVRFSPGRKTMLNIMECGSNYKVVCTLVDSLDGDLFLQNYSHSVLRPSIPIDEFFTTCMDLGITQHWGLTDGDYSVEVRQFCSLMGFEYNFIG